MGSLRKAVKGYKASSRWDEPFANEQFTIPDGRPTKVRLFNEIATIPTHWVSFKSKTKGDTGYYALCIDYDYANDEKVDKECPYCALDIRLSNYTYGLIIHRSEQRKGNLQVRPVRLTSKCTFDIIKLTDIAYPDEEWPEGFDDEDGGPEAVDLKYGFDIMLSKQSTNGKIEYPVHVAQNGIKPLKKDEVKAFRAYASQVNFAELAESSLSSISDIKKDLERIGLLKAGSAATKAKSRDYNDYDEAPEDDDDDDPVVEAKTKAKKKKKKGTKTRKAKSLDEDEDEERSLPWDDDDDDDEDEGPSRNYATADEDEAPEDDDDDEGYEDED